MADPSRADLDDEVARTATADHRSGPTIIPDDGQLEDRVAVALRRIFRGVELHSGRLSDACGLTGPQLALLRTVSRLQPTPVGAAARSIHLSHATVSGIVDRLVARGLVVRTKSTDDRRSVALTTTDAGEALLRTAPSVLPERFRSALATSPEWDRLHVLSMLERVGEMIDGQTDPPSASSTASPIASPTDR